MAVSAVRVDLALGGSYRQAVSDDAPVAWWRLAEAIGEATAKDASGSGRDGTYSGPTLEQAATVPDGGSAALFDGVDDFVSVPDHVSLDGFGDFSIELWMYPTSGQTPQDVIVKSPNTALTRSWEIYYDGIKKSLIAQLNGPGATTLSGATGVPIDGGWRPVIAQQGGLTRLFWQTDISELRMVRTGQLIGFGASLISAVNSVPLNTWTHAILRRSGSTVQWYINGVLDTSTTYGTVLNNSADALRIGDHTGTTLPFGGTIDEIAIYNIALSATRITVHYNAGRWTDVSNDLVAAAELHVSYGIAGNNPTDRVAEAGQAEFWLRNDAGNSGGLQGYYSPNHANVRTGFTYGVLCRVVFTYGGTEFVRFTGKIEHIDPEPGQYRTQRTRVVLVGIMGDLIETDLRNVTLQINQTESALLKTLVEALPIATQPLALRLAAGLDTIPFAFDNLGAGAKAIGPTGDLVISSLGFGYVNKRGEFVYENRQKRQTSTSLHTLNNAMRGLVVPTSLDGVFNRIRLTVHPKRIDTAATTVLWSQTGTAPSLAASSTTTIWGDYYKAGDPEVKIGGSEQIAPVATTDYTGNTQADGLGTDKTAQLTVTATFFASTVKFVIVNNDAGAVFLTKLQCRGKGLYDESPKTIEASSAQPYGERPIAIDLPYQSSTTTAQDLADYLLTQYKTQAIQAHSLMFDPQRTDALMQAALTGEVGDRITVIEQVTGLSTDLFIQRIDLTARGGRYLECTFGLTTGVFGTDFWVLEEAGSALGTNTNLGYG